MRAAGRLSRRPDRRRPRRARGPGERRRDPGVERRLPRPPAAADPHRGHGRDGGAARAAQRRAAPRPARSSTARSAKLEARRRRRRRRSRSTPASAARGDALARLRDRPAAGRPRAAPGAADLLRAGPRRGVRAGRRPARGASRRRARPTSTPGATAPRTTGCSGSTGSTARQVLDQPVTDADAAPPRPQRGPLRRSTSRPSGDAAPRSAGAAGSWSTTRSRRPGRSPTAALEVDLLVADRRWLERLLLRLAPHATVVRPAGRAPTRSQPRAQEPLGLYSRAATYDETATEPDCEELMMNRMLAMPRAAGN